MIPDLGKYAVHVLTAYGVALAGLGGLTWASVARWRRLKAQDRAGEPRG